MNRPFANAAFFPAAVVCAALILPWSVLALQGLVPAPSGLTTPGGHAHEMLFGYALAVVAGYLLGPQSVRWIAAVFGCWLAARLTFWFFPGAWPTFVFSGLFAALVAYKVMPRFMKSAKKWRNQTVAPVVGALALCTAAGAWLVGTEPGPAFMVLHMAVLLLAVLLFFMGGRIIAPALAGYIVKGGASMPHRVQPRVEGSVLILLPAAIVLTPVQAAWSAPVAGTALTVAGLLTGFRWLRWRPWLCRRRPDLVALLIGYGWLALGLVLMGLAHFVTGIPAQAATHAITAGALGTLTLTVMMRTRLLYRFRDANRLPMAHVATALVQVAALCRVVPPMVNADGNWLMIASGFWALAFVIGFGVLVRTLQPKDESRK
jgi:uncharacterized protein involved in response to NO